MVALKSETTTDSLSDERIVQLCNECAGVLASTDNEYYRSTVENILQRYATKKANLINLMRKHPEWDEQNLAIIQTQEFKRTIDLQLAKELIDAINDIGGVDTYYMADYNSVEHIAMDNQVYCVLSEFHKMVGERWNMLPLDALREWQSSLHIRKFYKLDTVLGVRKNPDTGEYTPTNIEAVDFVPYEGSNLEHQNLHKFVAGNGIISTVVEENRNNMAHRYKINRQVQLVFPEGQALLGSRLDPNHRDNATFDLLSGVMRDMIVTCTGNSFDMVVDSIDAGRSNSRYAFCDSNATLYSDWTYREYHTRLYSCIPPAELEPLDVGAAPLCVKCGDRHSDEDSLCCSDCQ